MPPVESLATLRFPYLNHAAEPVVSRVCYCDSKVYEIRRPRDASRKRKVSNTVTGSACALVPGPKDGTSDVYGVGDLWVVRYHASEIDNGQGFMRDPSLSIAHLDEFKNPAELVEDQDVVLWYAAHFLHDESHPGGPPHTVGPDLRQVRGDAARNTPLTTRLRTRLCRLLLEKELVSRGWSPSWSHTGRCPARLRKLFKAMF